MQSGSLVGIRTHCNTCFCTFGVDFYAQLVLINKKIFIGTQSEVYEEFVVGWVHL